jgi:predicted transposase YdaD
MPRRVEVINADIATLTAEADHVLRIHYELNDPWLLYLELQSSNKLGWPDRMLYKSTALRKRHELLVHSLILLLRPDAKASDLSGVLKLQIASDKPPYLEFRYQVINSWELSSNALLRGNLGLLPLAPLTDDAAPRLPEIISKIDERIRQELSWEESEKLRTSTMLLMGLRYETDFISKIINGVMPMVLENSSIIQSALAKGKVEGIELGRLQEVKAVLIRQGKAKFGAPDPNALAQLDSIQDLEYLEKLAEELLTVNSWQSLLE